MSPANRIRGILGHVRFDEVLRTFAELFEREGMRWAVAGGLAMGAWGHARGTHDIDFLVSGDDRQRVIAFADFTVRVTACWI
jgi:predicted nucleotidyltransferase